MGVKALNYVSYAVIFLGGRTALKTSGTTWETIRVLKVVAACGSYQMSHIWMVTLHSPATKHKLASAKELLVKGKRCLLIGPDKA